MKESKADKEIALLKEKINKRFHENCSSKIQQIKSKLMKSKAEWIYKKASKELYDRISRIK